MSGPADDPDAGPTPDPGSPGAAYELAMFPLGGVLFPYGVLPVHVFEPRYRVLMHDCLTGRREFGVVLIERGFEVGGGDSRFGVGTVARIVRASQSDDGRWGVITVGDRRIRVEEWLPEDPYPRARVVDLPTVPVDGSHAELIATAERTVRRALAMKTELAERTMVPATFELAEEADIAAWQLTAFAPLNQMDQVRLLGEDDPGRRLELLVELAADTAAMLEFRLGSGDSG